MGRAVIIRKYAVLAWAVLLASAAIAGEERHTRIEIDIDDDGGQTSFKFDSADAGFDLRDLAVGERRELVDDEGNVASVSRTEAGFELDVNGRTIDLSDLHDGHGMAMHMQSEAGDTDVVVVDDVRKARKVKMIKTGDDASVTIITAGAIDEATRERIREVLVSSGQDGEVVFIDGSEFKADTDKHTHRRHEVRVIKKEVDVTN